MSEIMGKREQKKLLARNKIMAAAIEQFTVQGFQAASVADIMRTADMGLGTFYNYFTSKEELLHALLDSLAVQLRERMQVLQAEEHSQAEILRSMVMLTARLVGENKYVLPLFLSAGVKTDEKPAEMPKSMPESMAQMAGDKPHGPAFMAMFLQLVQAGQQTGEFRQDVSAEVITEMFHSLFQAAAFSSLPLSFEENIHMKLNIIIDGMCKK